MSSILTRRLAPSDSSREAKLLRSVCQPRFERAILHVRRSYVDGVVGATKTDSSRRPLPIPAQALKALQDWKRESNFTASDDWVFASEFHFGKQPLWPGTLWQRNVTPAIKQAGISKPKR